jgi:predicted DCC family thiol-disulfide oxidoreductase YuxK
MNENVILFDGYCGLCNRFVDFIIKQDTKRKIKFASLQSNFGQSVLTKHFLFKSKNFPTL